MFHAIHAPSQHFTRNRAQGRDARAARPTPARRQWPMSRGEAFAIGLGCDNDKH